MQSKQGNDSREEIGERRNKLGRQISFFMFDFFEHESRLS